MQPKALRPLQKWGHKILAKWAFLQFCCCCSLKIRTRRLFPSTQPIPPPPIPGQTGLSTADHPPEGWAGSLSRPKILGFLRKKDRNERMSWRCCSVAKMCPTLCDPMGCSPPGSSVRGNSPGKNIGVGCHALLQGIFLNQGLNPCLLLGRWILSHWATRDAHLSCQPHLKVCKQQLQNSENMGERTGKPSRTKQLREGLDSELPGGLVVRAPRSHCPGPGFNPCSGN